MRSIRDHSRCAVRQARGGKIMAKEKNIGIAQQTSHQAWAEERNRRHRRLFAEIAAFEIPGDVRAPPWTGGQRRETD